MEKWQEEHLMRWLQTYVHEDEQFAVWNGIKDLLRHDPELIHNHSWPELRVLARGQALTGPFTASW